jgi:hypothetical protein
LEQSSDMRPTSERTDTDTQCGFPITVHVFANVRDTILFDTDNKLHRVIEAVAHATITLSANGTTLGGRRSRGDRLQAARRRRLRRNTT